jgi:hypothetical protein
MAARPQCSMRAGRPAAWATSAATSNRDLDERPHNLDDYDFTASALAERGGVVS